MMRGRACTQIPSFTSGCWNSGCPLKVKKREAHWKLVPDEAFPSNRLAAVGLCRDLAGVANLLCLSPCCFDYHHFSPVLARWLPG